MTRRPATRSMLCSLRIGLLGTIAFAAALSFAPGARAVIQHPGYSLTVLACNDGGTTTTEDSISGSSVSDQQNCGALAQGPQGHLDASVSASIPYGVYPKRAFATVNERIYLTSLPQGDAATVTTSADCGVRTDGTGAHRTAGWYLEVAGCRVSGELTNDDPTIVNNTTGCDEASGSEGITAGDQGSVIWTITLATFPSPNPYLPLEIGVTTELFGPADGAHATCLLTVAASGIAYEFANDTFLTDVPEPNCGTLGAAAAGALGWVGRRFAGKRRLAS